MICNFITRTEYSFLNSLCSLESLIDKAKEYNYKALAMTDINNLHGAYKFYNLCVKNNIKPIIGVELKVKDNEIEFPICLYPLDKIGFQNLYRLASKSKINGDYLDLPYLENNNMGLLCILPSNSSIIENRNIGYLNKLKDIFHDLYVGISKSHLNDGFFVLKSFLDNLQLEMVAVQDTRYFDYNDHETFVALSAVGLNKTVEEIENNNDYHFFRKEEFIKYFEDYDYLLENNQKIVSKINITIEKNSKLMPQYDSNIEANSYLKALALKGLTKRIGKLNDVYLNRLNKELDIIIKMGFADYFLIVWDYVLFAKKNNIYVGPGRGSAPASLVAYSLGITDIDPMKYNLLFERFLNPERISMPDIDIDFPDNERDKVISYVGKKYGKNRVAHIATFGTFAARSAIRDIAKVYKLSELRLNEIIKCLKQSRNSLKELLNDDINLKKLYTEYPDIRKVIDVAIKIEGLPRNVSTHAAGIIITKYDLINYTPLDNGLNDIYQTQFEASDLEDLGLLKMDFLGLRNLTIIKNCIDEIRKDIPEFTLPNNFNDYQTLKMIGSGDTTGIFQLESEGMRQTLRNMNASSFEDICSAIALYRPGPMDMIPKYIDVKKGKEKITYVHPDLRPILESTNGIIVYQEQIILIACKFAGYTLGQADVLRRAVSKKKKDVLEQERTRFVASSINNGYHEKVANEIYDYIVKFANYGFNKAHSVSYSVIAYQTAYLKCHYPNHYFCVLLNTVIGTNTLINDYISEISRRHLKVIAPNINLSTDRFAVMNNQILMPLTQIEGIGQQYVKDLLEIRKNGSFTSFEDFIERIGNVLPISLIENVIYSGALDQFKITKKSMIDNYPGIINRQKYAFVKNVTGVSYSLEEFSYGYLLEKEKQILGINVRYNFLFQYDGYYRKNIAKKIVDVKEGLYQILGIVTRIREITTKSNSKMFFADIKDDTGTMNLTIFPRLYLDFKEVVEGNVIIVKGNIEKRNGELQMVVEQFKVL